MISLHWIKTEGRARVAAISTGGTTAITFIEQLSPYIKFACLVMTFFTGVATFAYYVPLAVEKWRSLWKKP